MKADGDLALTFYSPAYLQKQLTNGHGRAAAILGNARSLAAGVAAREPVCEVECHAVLLGSPIRLTCPHGGDTCHLELETKVHPKVRNQGEGPY